MAVTVSTQTAPIGSKLVNDSAATTTASNNTTNAAGTLFMVEIDNTHASSTDVFLKIVDANSCTPGTTAPSMVLICPATSKRSYVFPEGIVFDVGFSHWLTTAAAQDSTAAPVVGREPKVRYVTS